MAKVTYHLKHTFPFFFFGLANMAIGLKIAYYAVVSPSQFPLYDYFDAAVLICSGFIILLSRWRFWTA